MVDLGALPLAESSRTGSEDPGDVKGIEAREIACQAPPLVHLRLASLDDGATT